MSRSRMLQVFKGKPSAVVAYKAQPVAIAPRVAVPSPRLLGVESSFLRRIYTGFLKITQFFHGVKTTQPFTTDMLLGVAGSIVANVIQQNQLQASRQNKALVLPRVGKKEDSKRAHEVPKVERMAATFVPVATTQVQIDDEPQQAETITIPKVEPKQIVKSHKPAFEKITFAPKKAKPETKEKVEEESEDEFFYPVKKAKPQVVKKEVKDDSIARYYLQLRLDEALKRAHKLNSRRYWNGRKKAAYIFDAVKAVEVYMNKNPRPFITDPDTYLESILGNGLSVTDALGWHRHRLFATTCYSKKETKSIEQFKHTTALVKLK